MGCFSNVNIKNYVIILFKVLKNKESIDPNVSKTSIKKMFLSKCAVCNSKKSRFNTEQEASGLLSKLGIKTPTIKIPLTGDIVLKSFFYWDSFHARLNNHYEA